MTRAQQKELTSKAILKASLTVFSEMDYNTATFSDISKIAKVTNGLIVQRFGSKEALYTQLVDEILLSQFPSFENCNNLYESLIEIIHFVKITGSNSIENLKFCSVIFKNVYSIPNRCKERIEKIFTTAKLKEIFDVEMAANFVQSSDAFDLFIVFFTNCTDLTITCIEASEDIPSDESYIQLFRKLDALHQAKAKHNDESALFENISDKSLKLYNIGTWYAEISEDREPALYFPQEILKRAGLKGDESPTEVYKFILEHVDSEDAPVVKDAIHRMFHGQYVEFEYRWCSPTLKTIYYRCSGKRTNVENGLSRFEGILQNISSFKTLRNRKRSRNFFLNLIAPDYEYVSYVHLGATADDDFVEDFKSSEFLNKLTDNWEHNNNFSDRFNIFFNKVLTGVDRERFYTLDNRQIILESLKKNDRFKTSFNIRHFGISYLYEAVFFPDKDDDKTITGLVVGIRLANSIANNLIGNANTDEEDSKDKMIADLVLDNHEAGFLVNLKDHTFEIIKESDHFARRNNFVPDFESFFKAYIKRDVYFEDAQKLIDATCYTNIKINTDKSDCFTITYRDISHSEPRYYLLRMTKGEGNLVAVLISNIHAEYTAANQEKDKLEQEIRTKEQEISSKNNMIENINTIIVDLLGDVIESQRKDGIKELQNIKHLTYVLGCQLMEDHPELGLTREYVAQIGEASVLHDIGKITIPDAILYKDGKLTPEEFNIIKTHTNQDEKILSKLKAIYDKSFYDLIISICKYHHERFDGTGYPEGLKGDEIPLPAQIVGLVDAFAALVSKRAYRCAYQPSFARDMIMSGKCGSFNPMILESFDHCSTRLTECLTKGVDNDTTEMNKATRDSFKFKTVINNQTMPIISHMAEQMPGGFFIYKNDPQGTLIYFNDIMVKYFNCANREDFMKYVNNSFKGIVRSDDFDKTVSTISNQISESEQDLNHTQYRVVCKNGEEKVFDHYGHVSHSDSFGEVSYAFVQDITEQQNKATIQDAPIVAPSTTNAFIDNGTGKERVKTLEGTRILIVDDNDLSRFMTKDTLEEEGAHVSDFSSGKEALEVIKKVKPFDIVLVDLVMPEMNGVDLTKAIREWEEDKDIRVPIVAVTGEVGSDLAKQCIEEGANGCMSKPLIIAELARILILSMKEHASKMDRKLSSTIQKANTDVLTHVKNRTAFAERLEQIEALLKNDPYYEFGIVGADVNNLKYANDTFGHDIGDIYIKNCCQMLTDVFAHSPVYRTGGDEFSIILEGTDLRDYKRLMTRLREMNIEHSAIEDYEKGRAHIAMGCAIYDPKTDLCIDDVIKRADEVMYKNKEAEKARVAGSFAR